jgi:hypothetical protein
MSKRLFIPDFYFKWLLVAIHGIKQAGKNISEAQFPIQERTFQRVTQGDSRNTRFSVSEFLRVRRLE